MFRKKKPRNFIFRLGFTWASVELGQTLAIVTINQGSEAPVPVQAHITKRSSVENPVKALSIIEDLTNKKGWKWIA